MHRMLYLSPRHSLPPKDPQKNMFYHLSRYFSGDLLAPTWWKKNPEGMKRIRDANAGMGNFQYRVTFSSELPNLIKIFWDIFFYVFEGLYLHYFKGKYDVIVVYGPFKTGLAGYLLKVFTGAKFILRIPGNYKKAYLYESEKLAIMERVKHKISSLVLPFILNRADHLNLLYPGQLDGIKGLRQNNFSVFHDFATVSTINPSEESDKYILLIGFPWYLKGVDILIRAFKSVSNEFPEFRVKIVGFCPDKTYFRQLAEGNDNIELCDPVLHDEAMRLMSKCTLFVLPSRTEAMGLVLLEAMASKKPIVASNVDGIPQYVRNGFNGLLFESENVEDLANKIRIVLGDPSYAAYLAESGYRYVHEYLSEEHFVKCFKDMVERTL
jgi:glycosyltransferase involved in cell wall biosynthesis